MCLNADVLFFRDGIECEEKAESSQAKNAARAQDEANQKFGDFYFLVWFVIDDDNDDESSNGYK